MQIILPRNQVSQLGTTGSFLKGGRGLAIGQYDSLENALTEKNRIPIAGELPKRTPEGKNGKHTLAKEKSKHGGTITF